MREPIEFECVNTTTPDSETVFAHFESDNYRLYDDGAGYVDIKCKEPCPHCGEHHWSQGKAERFH